MPMMFQQNWSPQVMPATNFVLQNNFNNPNISNMQSQSQNYPPPPPPANQGYPPNPNQGYPPQNGGYGQSYEQGYEMQMQNPQANKQIHPQQPYPNQGNPPQQYSPPKLVGTQGQGQTYNEEMD